MVDPSPIRANRHPPPACCATFEICRNQPHRLRVNRGGLAAPGVCTPWKRELVDRGFRARDFPNHQRKVHTHIILP